MKSLTNSISISVVIPAWNVQDYIARAIQSVLDQTFPPTEIIVINDGSTDNTAAIVQQFSSSVTCIHQKNRGLSAARNRGTELAQGNWIAWLDADDQWHPQKLQFQAQLIQTYPELTWCATGYLPNTLADLNSIDSHPQATIASFFDFDQQNRTILPSSVIIRKSTLQTLGGFHPGRYFGEDVDLWLRLALANHSLGYCSQPLVNYTSQRPASLNDQTDSLDRMSDITATFERLLPNAKTSSHFASYCHFVRKRIQVYINQLMQTHQISAARQILTCYRYCFNSRQRLEYRLRTLSPTLNHLISQYHSIKK